GAMIDITDRKMAEEKLKQTLEELRKANEELEAYVHAISHDLRAPLRNLQGYVSALVEDYGEKLEEDARFYLSRLKALTEKMDGLINDLLEYARVSKAKAEVRRVDLNLIVEDVLDYLKDEIRGKSAVIEIEKLPAVKGDRKLLFTVMLNLISNAIKFVEEGVRPEVKVWAEDVNGKVRVYVKDNGIGIPEEYHEKIFNIFERLHGEEVYPGTGVGLAIVKKAMEVMGGRYGVRSGIYFR
ncbi:MAG: Signal-transducing histidine kinase, partial [Archaeoglobus fulgidus]